MKPRIDPGFTAPEADNLVIVPMGPCQDSDDGRSSTREREANRYVYTCSYRIVDVILIRPAGCTV